MFEGQRLLLLWLCLAEILVGSLSSAWFMYTGYPTPDSHYYVMDTELYPGKSFLYAYVEKINYNPYKGNTRVNIKGPGRYTTDRWMDWKLDNNVTRVGVSSLKRMNASTGLLTVFNETKSGDTLLKLFYFNLWDPKGFTLVPLDLPKEHIILTYRDNENFEILVSDQHVCKSPNGKCRLSYDGQLNRTVEPFDIDLDWKSLRVEYERPSRNFLIRGLHNNDTHKFLLIDRHSGTRQELFSIPNARNMEIMSSQYLICWIEKPGEDKSINCSQFNKNGDLIFHRVETYPTPVAIVSLQQLTDNVTFLLTRKVNCEGGADCWNFAFTLLQPTVHKKFTQYPLDFRCTERNKPFIFRSELFEYGVTAKFVCEDNRTFAYGGGVIIRPNEL